MEIIKVILVDSKDAPIGEMEKIEAHKKALLHRAVSVFIFNSKKELLIQKRALSKYHSPGLWTNTACTHPYPYENNKDAAARRLKEEMGIKAELFKAFDFIYKEKLDNDLTEHEFDHVFIGFCDDTPKPDSNEVHSFNYVDINLILNNINESPGSYTVWFKRIIERVLNYVQEKELSFKPSH